MQQCQCSLRSLQRFVPSIAFGQSNAAGAASSQVRIYTILFRVLFLLDIKKMCQRVPLIDWSIDWLGFFRWLIDWLGFVDWLIDWLGFADWLIDWVSLVDWSIDWFIYYFIHHVFNVFFFFKVTKLGLPIFHLWIIHLCIQWLISCLNSLKLSCQLFSLGFFLLINFTDAMAADR